MHNPITFFNKTVSLFGSKISIIRLLTAFSLVLAPTTHALIIKNGGNHNYRFFDPALGPLNTAPPNPDFIGKDLNGNLLDLSGVAVSAMNGTNPHFGGAMMISPHYFVTATHYYGATTYNFRNRDGVMITKAVEGGRAMSRSFPNGDGQLTDIYIGKLAGAGITVEDKISIYPIVMELTNNAFWYIGKQIFIYSMNGGNSFGINTITQVADSGPPNLIGKSILYNYSGAYTNQAGVNGESGSPWGFVWNNQFCAGGAHSAFYGVVSPSLSSNYTSISTFLPAFADQIDSYIAESHPIEKLTRLEVFNDAPEITVNPSVTIHAPFTSETVYVNYVDDNLPLNAVRTLTASSSDQTILPDSGLVLSGTSARRTLVITPAAGANGVVTVSLTSSDGEATAVKTFKVTIIGTAAVDKPAASGDDAEQLSTGTVLSTNPELQFGGGRMVGLRFPKLYIPTGAIITSASVQFTSGVPQSGPAALEIFVQDTYNATSFAGGDGPSNFNARILKSTSVLWQPADWNTASERGAAQRTPDITALVQQALDNIYWGFGQSMVLIIKGSGSRFADAQDKVGGQPAQLNVTFFVPKQNASFSISSSSDDAEQSSSGAVNLSDRDLELVYDGPVAGNQTVGLRFNNISVPKGAKLTSAAIQFTADIPFSNAASLIVRNQLADNASSFTATVNNLSSRPQTVASTTWSMQPWMAIGDQSFAQSTPDMTPMVSEVLSRPGWTSGNSLAFLFTGNGRRTANAFDDNLGVPAKLKLSYIAPQQPHSYDAWINSVPSLTTAQRLPNADPDGDQLTNLMEFATGQNVAVPNASPLSVQTAPGQFHLVYNRPRTTYEITYVVEWTDDLASDSWSSVGTTQQVIATNGATQTYRAVIPMLQTNGNAAPRRFARLRVLLGAGPAVFGF